MRLWHYKLIPYLPKSQLLAQWRELNSIFKRQDKHILINYIYEYPKNDLYTYTIMVTQEMIKRGYKIKTRDNFYNYFGVDATTYLEMVETPFKNHHDFEYLQICYYNLKEKYMRHQKDFSKELFNDLENFYNEEYLEDIKRNCIIVDLKKRRKK